MSKFSRPSPSADRRWFRLVTNTAANLNHTTKVPRGGIRL